MRLLVRPFLIACLLLSAAGCQQKSGDDPTDSDDSSETDGNQALYDQVMDIHDEVMPKMDALYKAKTALRTRLEMPGTAENEKEDINAKLADIDSASEGMMVWMREFDPIPDSLGEDKARAYLENELVKVKKVKEDILEALKKAE